MSLSTISADLKRGLIGGHDSALNLSAYEVAGFLGICKHALIDYINHSNGQNDCSPTSFVTLEEIRMIDSIFQELIENFFPMAHTEKPLRDLKIIDVEGFVRVRDEINRLANICTSANEASEKLDRSIQDLVGR